MSGLNPAINYIKDGINRAADTRSAILFTVEANERINKRIKEIEEEAKKGIEDLNSNEFDFSKFDINDVPSIVLRDIENEGR